MRATHVFSGIPTADLASAIAWYERLLGRPPDNRPNEHEAVWQLAESGLIYVVADGARAGNGMLTVIVEDLDDWIAELEGRGISAGAIEAVPGIARRVALIDPDGNLFTIAQLLSRSE